MRIHSSEQQHAENALWRATGLFFGCSSRKKDIERAGYNASADCCFNHGFAFTGVASGSTCFASRELAPDVKINAAYSVVLVETMQMTRFGRFSRSGIGSGVIICETGFIVTNNHVVSNATGGFADKINVRLKNGQTFEAVVAWHNPDADLAIIKTDAYELSAARFGIIPEHCAYVFAAGYSARTQEMIIAEGFYTGRTDAFVFEGIRIEMIQTTTELVRGNSGGGLFNSYGELVGIVTAKYVGIGADSIGLSVPIDLLPPYVISSRRDACKILPLRQQHPVGKHFFAAGALEHFNQILYGEVRFLFALHVEDYISVVHHYYAIAVFEGVAHVVRNAKRCEIVFVHDFIGEVEDGCCGFGVKGGGVFVEEENAGFFERRHKKRQSLPLSAGK